MFEMSVAYGSSLNYRVSPTSTLHIAISHLYIQNLKEYLRSGPVPPGSVVPQCIIITDDCLNQLSLGS